MIVLFLIINSDGGVCVKKLNIIQLGIGHDHGTSGFNSILKQDDIFNVVGFAVPECETEKFADRIKEYRDDRKIPYYSIEDILNLPDVDAAIIESEEKNLTKLALMAVEKGLHIYVDKPGSADYNEFEKLVNTAKNKKLAFAMGYMYRYNPKVKEVMEKIKNGELGEIYCVEAHMDCEHKPEKRKWLSQFPGGMMFFLGCHLIDLIYRIQGEPNEIIPLNCSTKFGDVTAEDYGMVAYRYPNGISFVKTCANEIGGFRRRQLVVCGTKGSVEIKPFEILTDERDMLYTEMRETYKAEGWNSSGKPTKSDYFNRFDDMMRDFAMVALGEKENDYGYEYELGLYKLLLKSCGITI